MRIMTVLPLQSAQKEDISYPVWWVNRTIGLSGGFVIVLCIWCNMAGQIAPNLQLTRSLSAMATL
jgi:hypothetical protein